MSKWSPFDVVASCFNVISNCRRVIMFQKGLEMFRFPVVKSPLRLPNVKIVDMSITAACVIFLIKLRWPKTKSLYNRSLFDI